MAQVPAASGRAACSRQVASLTVRVRSDLPQDLATATAAVTVWRLSPGWAFRCGALLCRSTCRPFCRLGHTCVEIRRGFAAPQKTHPDSDRRSWRASGHWSCARRALCGDRRPTALSARRCRSPNHGSNPAGAPNPCMDRAARHCCHARECCRKLSAHLAHPRSAIGAKGCGADFVKAVDRLQVDCEVPALGKALILPRRSGACLAKCADLQRPLITMLPTAVLDRHLAEPLCFSCRNNR